MEKEAYQRTRKRSRSRSARPVNRAAAGASAQRDAAPTAPGRATREQLHDTRWYQFCFRGIVSMLRMPIHGVRMITESVFKRGRHGQESEESKEERESHQESGKEDFEEKEVVV